MQLVYIFTFSDKLTCVQVASLYDIVAQSTRVLLFFSVAYVHTELTERNDSGEVVDAKLPAFSRVFRAEP
jgi:hypothetical protein